MTRAALLVVLAATPALGQEWYIPKRQTLLSRGSGELGMRLQQSANNDGLLDTLRLEAIPHVRYAPLRRLELYTELPFSYVEREDVVAFNLIKNDTTGIGDAFAQVGLEGFSGEDWKILYNLDGTFPSGKSPYKHRVAIGNGHFAAALGQTMMKVIDPVVLFMHLGYQHVFARRTPAGWVSPGRSIRYRFGAALALNPRVQTTLHVTGEGVKTTRVDGRPVAGTSGTLLRFGWGLDWRIGDRWRWHFDSALGMTKNTPDATLSTGWSWRF